MADLAQQRLEEMIVTLQLPPGSRWTEEAFSDMMGIGRTPVREAVKRLQSDYLIKILPRHGLMVADINVHEQLLVVEFRRDLEMFISLHATQRALTEERKQLTEIASSIEISGKSKDVLDYLRAVFNANQAIVQAARNPFVARSISPLHAMSRRFFYRYISDMPSVQDVAELHAERARAIAARDEERTGLAVTALMDCVQGYTLRIFDMLAARPVKSVTAKLSPSTTR